MIFCRLFSQNDFRPSSLRTRKDLSHLLGHGIVPYQVIYTSWIEWYDLHVKVDIAEQSQMLVLYEVGDGSCTVQHSIYYLLPSTTSIYLGISIPIKDSASRYNKYKERCKSAIIPTQPKPQQYNNTVRKLGHNK